MEQKSKVRNKISNVLELAVFSVLALLIFIFPFKFSLPFAEGVSQFFPSMIDEWIFFSWPESIAYLLILFALLLTLIRFFVKGEISIYKTPFDFWIVGFIIVLFISYYMSINHYRSLIFVIRFFMSILLYYVVRFNADNFKLWKFLVIALVSACVLLCLYGSYQFFYGLAETRIWVMKAKESGFLFSDQLLHRLSGNRIFSTFVYPNAFAGYLLLVLPFSYLAFFLKNKDDKIRFFLYPFVIGVLGTFFFLNVLDKKDLFFNAFCFLVFYPVTAVAVFFLTLSKGAVLSLFLAGGLVIFYRKQKKKKFLISFLCIVFLLLASICFFVPEIKDVILLRLKAKTLSVRLDYWKVAFSIFLDFPWFGCGSDNYGLLYPLYWKPQTEITQMAHNNYLQILAETGFIGAIFFLGLICSVLLQVIKFFRKLRVESVAEKNIYDRNVFLICIGFALVSAIIHFGVDFDIYIFSILAYFMILLALFSSWAFTKDGALFVLKGTSLKVGVLLLIVFIGAGSFFINKKTQADFAFFKARQLYAKGDLDGAAFATKKAITIMGENHVYTLLFSRLFYSAKAYEASLYWAQRAIFHNKYFADAYKQLADIYEAMEQNKKGNDNNKKIEDMLKKACFYAPHKIKYRISLANFYIKAGLIEKAQEILKEAEVISPDNDIVLAKIKECSFLINRGE